MGCTTSSASAQKSLEANSKTQPLGGSQSHPPEGVVEPGGNGAENVIAHSQIEQNVLGRNLAGEILGELPERTDDLLEESKKLHLKSEPTVSSKPEQRALGGPTPQTDDDVTKPLFQSNNPPELKAELTSSVKNTKGNSSPTITSQDISQSQGLSLDQTEHLTKPEVETVLMNSDEKERNSDTMDDHSTAQAEFQTALRCSCSLVDPETVYQFANDKVTFLQLNRTLPYNYSLSSFLARLPNLQELDVSGNNMGPQPFRLLMLAMAHNASITWLNAANNMADTDSAESIGIMLSKNRSLLYLDVSGNYLGKDFFSRSVGPAMAANDSLLVLRCEGIGSTDLTVLMKNLKKNSTLQELSISHNQFTQPQDFTSPLVELLTNKETKLSSLEMRNCNLDEKDFVVMATALEQNETITNLNLASNSVTSHNTLLKVVLSSLKHKSMTSLNLDDTRVTHPDDQKIDIKDKISGPAPIESLSLANCSLMNSHLEALMSALEGSTLTNLRSLNLSNNPKVTVTEMAPVMSLCLVGLQRLNLGLNDCQDIELLQQSRSDMKLTYLNLRKAKVKYDTIKDLYQLFDQQEEATLVLDGIRFSGSGMKELKDLLVNFRNLSALSLGGCCLSDGDIQHLCDVISTPGLPLHMLKLAANRISDKGVNALVEALVSHESHPLKLVDLSDNQISSKGANKLCELCKHTSHRTQIHSLNISRNNIDAVGLKALASLIGQSSITCLHLNNQSATFREEEVEEICEEVINGLGLQITRKDGDVMASCAKLEPMPPSGFFVKLSGLAGESGQLGRHLDSVAITTDYSKQRLPYSSMLQAGELAAFLSGKERCEITTEEWDIIISAKKECPQWLKVPENLEQTVYLSHLPSSVMVQKMEGVFENDVDCDVTEVYLLKDPISRKNNGFAWALLGSREDVNKAMEYMNTGEAQLYSHPYVISPLGVSSLSGSQDTDRAAQSEIAARKATRRREEEEHRALLRKSYLESQERHAYRLAHPAYADGRIW